MRLSITEIIWKEQFEEKLEVKHQVAATEVEDVLTSDTYVRRVEKGRVPGEDLYAAYGQTEAGRYLFVLFLYKKPFRAALPISARNMTAQERRLYGQRKARR